jgi:hypothetical protein
VIHSIQFSVLGYRGAGQFPDSRAHKSPDEMKTPSNQSINRSQQQQQQATATTHTK